MEPQADLFSALAPVGRSRPEGFEDWHDVITPAGELNVVHRLKELTFKPYEFRGYFGNRQVATFGCRYDQDRRAVERAEPMPDFLLALRDQVVAATGLAPEAFVQALINEYAPGAGIGWHRDRPCWGAIVGLSLVSPCTLRLRRLAGATWERAAAYQPPRSAYLLSGEARSLWEHSITPMTALRYSVTFRTLSDGPGYIGAPFTGRSANGSASSIPSRR